ncbi:MAG: molecular chaperone [Bacteroidota bacterium]
MTNSGFKRKTSAICVLAIIFASVLFAHSDALAQGNLLVTPRRVVFEGNKQSQELTLANTGVDTAKYTVSFVQYRMNAEGGFEQIEQPDSGQLFADKYLRFFPRTVSLPPNGSQIIRMQYRKMPDMQNAEYRSHVYFRAVPTEKPLGSDETTKDSTAIGVKLVPIFGISIPVIIRNGDLDLQVNLTNLKLDLKSDTVPNLSVTFVRSGNKSVYGDLSASWVSAQKEPVEVGIVRGIAVYTPNTLRNFKMQLRNLPGVDYTKGKLLVKFQAQNDAKAEVFAEKEFPLE